MPESRPSAAVARPRPASRRVAFAGRLALLLVAAGVACKTAGPPTEKPPGPLVQPPALPATRVSEKLVVAAWSEPKELPAGGGQAQVLVRVQHRGGVPYPGVEVRLSTSSGT